MARRGKKGLQRYGFQRNKLAACLEVNDIDQSAGLAVISCVRVRRLNAEHAGGVYFFSDRTTWNRLHRVRTLQNGFKIKIIDVRLGRKKS